MIEALITLLMAQPAISTLAKTGYPSVLGRGYALPAFVAHEYGGLKPLDTNGPTGQEETRAQFDCYGSDADSARAVADAIAKFLIGYTGVLSNGARVQIANLENEFDMPFVHSATATGPMYRSVLQVRLEHTAPTS